MAERRLRVLIVDDEPLARHRIEDLLRHEPDVDLVGEADDGAEAVRRIEALRPDLVFLDVQMPGLSGLEVVAKVGAGRMPATVFVTAYDQHALKAFELAAVDYLVKPFDDDRFLQAFRRARERVRLAEVSRLTEQLISALGRGDAAPAASVERFAVESRGQTRWVEDAAVDFITAAGPYAELHVGGAVHLVRERMQELEKRLDPSRFVRVHRSAIVQVDRVVALRRTSGGESVAQLADGREVPVSRSRRADLERRLRR